MRRPDILGPDHPARHRVDGVSLGFGLVFALVAAWVLVIELTEVTFDGGHRWILPTVLLLAGSVGLVSSLTRRRTCARGHHVGGWQATDRWLVSGCAVAAPPCFGGARTPLDAPARVRRDRRAGDQATWTHEAPPRQNQSRTCLST